MRMRKLGSEHSVAFFASEEIQRKIASCVNKPSEDALDSSDVLLWALRQTCAHIVKDGALWASQGENYDRRSTAWEKYKGGVYSRADVANVLLEPESRSLEELYGVRDKEDEIIGGDHSLSMCQRAIYDKCKEFGFRPGRGSALLEEQERELSHEKEEERQVQRAAGASPLNHSLDPALRILVKTGRYPASLRYISLSDCLHQTSQASELHHISDKFLRSDQLYATEDFARTIDVSRGGHIDHFLRPVQWILSAKSSKSLLLLSPFEANELLPQIRSSEHASLHIYSPRTSRAMPSFEHLKFFTLPSHSSISPPRHTIHELNLFSGQLFFRDRLSFEETSNMLGLHLSEIPESLQGNVDVLGFITNEQERQRLGALFKKNPVHFLRDLIGWRRKGQGIVLTHVGLMLHGNNLGEDEFEEVYNDRGREGTRGHEEGTSTQEATEVRAQINY